MFYHYRGVPATRIYEKLEVRTRLDLLSLAIERGWVQDARSGSRGSA